jgi:drug/metabolite transporter (DMT)-like permease
MDRRAWFWLLALGAIWGASYMFIAIGLRDLSPGMVAFLRVAMAAAVIVPVAATQGALTGARRYTGWLILVGLAQVVGPFLLIGAGEEEIASSLAGILVAAAPLWTAVLAIWVDHEERSQGLRLVGVLIGFAGVGLLLGVDVGGSTSELLGGLAVVAAALGYAVGGMLAKHRLVGLAPVGMSGLVMTASALLLLPVAVATPPASFPSLGPIAAVVALGLVGTGAAFVIFYWLISTVGPARTFIVTYIAPAFAIFYGALFLSEEITAATIAGLVLILAGSWLSVEGRLPWQRRAFAPDELAAGEVTQ